MGVGGEGEQRHGLCVYEQEIKDWYQDWCGHQVLDIWIVVV